VILIFRSEIKLIIVLIAEGLVNAQNKQKRNRKNCAFSKTEENEEETETETIAERQIVMG
jgi:hypothetical protein